RREEAQFARRPKDIVAHFRPVQVSDAEHLFELRDTRGDFRGSDAESLFPVLDGLVHISLIRVELGQAVMLLDEVERAGLIAKFPGGWIQSLIEPIDGTCQRVFADFATHARILLPAGRLRELL